MRGMTGGQSADLAQLRQTLVAAMTAVWRLNVDLLPLEPGVRQDIARLVHGDAERVITVLWPHVAAAVEEARKDERGNWRTVHPYRLATPDEVPETVPDETATEICGLSGNYGPHLEPLACAYPKGHDGPHATASLPTFVNGVPVKEHSDDQDA